MFQEKKTEASLKWIVGFITISFVLCATSLSYSAEVEEIRAAISQQKATWIAEENSISKLPEEERIKLLGALPGEEPFEGEEIYSGRESLVSIVPKSVDWRNNGGNYVSSVKNQGSCGSCWAFAVTGALESKAMISLGTPGKNLNLSEQIVLSCSAAGSCSGGSISSASAFLYSDGNGKENCYPYTGRNGSCSNACSNRTVRPYRLTSSYAWVATNEDAMKSAIATYGPIVVTMAVYTDFYYYAGGVYRHAWGGLRGLHAVLAVGYDDTNRYFIVKNSWGTDWGSGGYFKISYDEINGDVKFGWGWCVNGYGDIYPCGAGSIYYPSDVLPVSVTLTSPNGGDLLESGGKFDITWNPPYNAGDYDLYYSLNGGDTWNLIEQYVTGTNYLWNVPILPNNKSKCLIGIADFYSNKWMSEDISNARFTIEVVGLTSPNGGEFVSSGGSWEITWTTNATKNPVASVKLYYTLDNGLTWKPITTLTENTGSYSWQTVPVVAKDKTKCRVKVVLKDGAGKVVGSDMSDSTFTITNGPI
jgi:C1A family cysteine protease